MGCPVCGGDICHCGTDLAEGFISGGEPDGSAPYDTTGDYVPDTTYVPPGGLYPDNDP
jgi:hypothetical protein